MILRLRPGPVARGEFSALAEVRPLVVFRLLAAQAVSVTAEMIAALTDDPAVDLIWPDLPRAHMARPTPLRPFGRPACGIPASQAAGSRWRCSTRVLTPTTRTLQGRVVAYRDFVEPNEADGVHSARSQRSRIPRRRHRRGFGCGKRRTVSGRGARRGSCHRPRAGRERKRPNQHRHGRH